MAAKKLKKPRRRRASRRAKRGTHTSLKGGVFNYRSGWELAYAVWLDFNPDVASYRYEPYVVEYVSNVRTGKVRKYYPDFEVTMKDGVRKLVEVKPKKKVNLARNVKKFSYARAHCLKLGIAFVVVTEVDLKALGLLK
jgi:hypothetical protein